MFKYVLVYAINKNTHWSIYSFAKPENYWPNIRPVLNLYAQNFLVKNFWLLFTLWSQCQI